MENKAFKFSPVFAALGTNLPKAEDLVLCVGGCGRLLLACSPHRRCPVCEAKGKGAF